MSGAATARRGVRAVVNGRQQKPGSAAPMPGARDVCPAPATSVCGGSLNAPDQGLIPELDNTLGVAYLTIRQPFPTVA
ncbi:hypothetical protein GCM10011579_023590 [Streptomyces albiflavescens]|uniref:Uncharacterized protein n=1 Tax=Streptomyces albiflavescens TaxID=1623582 RepID=A0A918D2I9_9ACTN|nr:hypothetical protein GCM10011579_023590 [Streptomyces albiflavescens]